MPVVMGTAGHIDHGKTTLIKALSGTDCDRLKEEKKRGITIELGFACIDLPEGERIGIVDVPGHEKFVKNMVSGAAGIDFVLLVVAADEGVMPQTREHLEICSLLGIDRGLVALTKVDMVDAELLELAKEDIQEFLSPTFLADAAICPVSAHSGEGIEVLSQEIVNIASSVSSRSGSNLFRLPVDRVFSMRGHGTVVTGTLVSGQVGLGESIAIYPHGKKTKVRGLQVHGSMVNTAYAGQRTAVNLSNLEVDDLKRGNVLARAGTLLPSLVWDVEINYLASAPHPLKNRTEVHLHHGSQEVLARIHLLDRDKLKNEERALAQVRFKKPMVGVFEDRIVLRSFSPLRTIAGARLINPLGRKIKRFSKDLDLLENLCSQDTESIILTQLYMADVQGLSLAELQVLTNMQDKNLEKLLQDLGARQKVFLFDRDERRYALGEKVEELTSSLLEYIKVFHQKKPLESGVSRSMIASDWGRVLPVKLLHFILERSLKQALIVSEQEVLRLPEHKVSLALDQEKLKQSILQVYKRAYTQPPNFREVLNTLQISQQDASPVFKLLTEKNELIKVKDDLYFSPEAIKGIKGRILDYFKQKSDLGPKDFKELTGLSRKYAIPILEYFDRQKVTMRVGDVRKLRKG